MTRRDDPQFLVVDDNPDICLNLRDILNDLGYSVDFAYDGPSALELVRRSPYVVALLDLKMPGMDGLTLHREIKKQRAGMVALLVTAYAGPATAEEALSAGAWKVVPKPVDLSKLLGLVDEALGQPLVLVVDDARDLCANLWDLLRERGFRVCLAHDGREAADKLKETTFKVVLIDFEDPRRRRRVPACPRGEPAGPHPPDHRLPLGDGPVRCAGARRGADAVCYKPFDVPQLLKSLGHLVEVREEGTGDRPS